MIKKMAYKPGVDCKMKSGSDVSTEYLRYSGCEKKFPNAIAVEDFASAMLNICSQRSLSRLKGGVI
jgi:hypothetical protein